MLFTASLNSGSNGNCYYIGNQREAVLVDVGISCRELTKRMKRTGLSMEKVRAIFISHEHTDHISGVEVTAKKYNLPVYITEGTLANSYLQLDESQVRSFKAYEPVTVGELSVTAFPKFHDAADPYSFVIEGNEICIGVFTDIGTCCEHVIRNFKQCHAVYLETNYDEEMLKNGRYPFFLKKRISGDHGHLSNHQALQLFLEHGSEKLSHLFLSHLSKDNNSPQLAEELFLKHAGQTQIVVASRYGETAVYRVEKDAMRKSAVASAADQLSLF